MELSNRQLREKSDATIKEMKALVNSVLALKVQEKELDSKRKQERNFLHSNDTLNEKQRELDAKIAESKEVKKQIDFIKKTFKHDSNYEWMIETENRIKSDKTAVNKLRAENTDLQKMLEKHERLLNDTEEAKAMNEDLKNMEQQMAEMEAKMRGVTKKLQEEEKKYLEQHEMVVNVEDRCRKMQEIIKHRVSEYKKVKDIVTEDDIKELDEQYEEMVFDKEE